jgi:predicted RNA-binding protein with PUA domain
MVPPKYPYSTKFEKGGFGKICGFDHIDEVITDNGICLFYKKSLRRFWYKNNYCGVKLKSFKN